MIQSPVIKAALSLTVVVHWSVSENLVELGEIQDHQQLVRFGLCCHLLSSHHRLDAKLPLCHVKCQLVVTRHVFFIQRVEVTEEGPE